MTRYTYGETSPFPPAFEDDAWAFGFGLFGDVAAAALCLAMLVTYALEAKRHREVTALLKNPVIQNPGPKWSVLRIFRLGNIAMLLFIVMRCLPDALWMLAWGEVSERTMISLIYADLIFDGVALIPLGLSVLCWVWGRQVIPQVLASIPVIGPRSAGFGETVFRNSRIVLAVFIITVGVTIGKASA